MRRDEKIPRFSFLLREREELFEGLSREAFKAPENASAIAPMIALTSSEKLWTPHLVSAELVRQSGLRESTVMSRLAAANPLTLEAATELFAYEQVPVKIEFIPAMAREVTGLLSRSALDIVGFSSDCVEGCVRLYDEPERSACISRCLGASPAPG